MTIKKEIIINKSVGDAWKVLGGQFTEVDKWASAVTHSEGSGKKFNGATCSERGCSTSMGGLKEKLTKFSNESHSLSYQIVEGMPSMVKYAENNWHLSAIGDKKSKLQMRMELEISGLLGMIMQPMMKIQMSKMGKELTEEFKYYVENGQPHPRKIKAMKKGN